MKVYWWYYSHSWDQVHWVSWPDWMLGRHGSKSKTVTDGTLFVNTSNLLHIWLESSVQYDTFDYFCVPRCCKSDVWEKNDLSVTKTPSFLSGNGWDSICKHFQHFKKDDFYNLRYKFLENKHMDHWHRPKYHTLQ